MEALLKGSTGVRAFGIARGDGKGRWGAVMRAYRHPAAHVDDGGSAQPRVLHERRASDGHHGKRSGAPPCMRWRGPARSDCTAAPISRLGVRCPTIATFAASPPSAGFPTSGWRPLGLLLGVFDLATRAFLLGSETPAQGLSSNKFFRSFCAADVHRIRHVVHLKTRFSTGSPTAPSTGTFASGPAGAVRLPEPPASPAPGALPRPPSPGAALRSCATCARRPHQDRSPEPG